MEANNNRVTERVREGQKQGGVQAQQPIEWQHNCHICHMATNCGNVVVSLLQVYPFNRPSAQAEYLLKKSYLLD